MSKEPIMYKVSVEIEIAHDGDVTSPLDAAKKAAEWLKESAGNMQYYVQDSTLAVHSVDLSEFDDDAVLPVNNYQPFIV